MRIFARLIGMFAGLLAITAASSGRAAPVSGASRSPHAVAPSRPGHAIRPIRASRGVVLFLSDSNGVSTIETAIAQALGQRGLLVALVSTPALLKAPEAWGRRCLNANFPLVALFNDVQHRMGVKAYMKPVLLGGRGRRHARLCQLVAMGERFRSGGGLGRFRSGAVFD